MSYILFKEYLEYKESCNSNNDLIEDVVIDSKEDEQEEFNIDWEKLETINVDIIGWIKIDNTNINYPILKDNDSLKYLNRSYDGKYNKNGSIFTLNNNPFIDDVTTIYGHNMKSGIMFSALGKYLDEDFFYQHSIFFIYTKNQNYKATIFSCYSTNVNTEENNLKNLEFNDEIKYYKRKSKIAVNNIDNIEKIIKLSTCSYINNHTTPTNQRYYIMAKLEKIN